MSYSWGGRIVYPSVTKHGHCVNGAFAWTIGLNRLLPSGSQTWLAGKSMNIPYKGGLKLGTSYRYMGNCPLPCLPEGSTLTRINRLVVCHISVCVCGVHFFCMPVKNENDDADAVNICEYISIMLM